MINDGVDFSVINKYNLFNKNYVDIQNIYIKLIIIFSKNYEHFG